MWTGVIPAVAIKVTKRDRLGLGRMRSRFGPLVEAGCDCLGVTGSLEFPPDGKTALVKAAPTAAGR